jgi:hypothetical protein
MYFTDSQRLSLSWGLVSGSESNNTKNRKHQSLCEAHAIIARKAAFN